VRHATLARFCPSIFLSLITLFALHGMSTADDRSAANPQPVAYAYLGSGMPGQPDPTAGMITAFAVAADGSAQPISHTIGGIGTLTATSGFVFGIGKSGTTVSTYTPQADGSLRATSAVNIIQNYLQGEDEYVANLNPDRSGRILNVGAVWPNSDFVPFAIASDGSLLYLGTTISGCGKSQALLTFSPDNRWAYDGCSYQYNKYGRQANGILDGPFDFTINQPPSPLGSGACQPVLLASSSLGYVAVVWNGSSYLCNSNQGNLLATYSVDADGNPALVSGSTVAPQLWESDIAFDPSGTYFALAGYVGDHSAGAIQVFKLQPDGKPLPLGNASLLSGVTNVTSVRWDNFGHLYAVGGGQDQQACAGNHSGCGLYIFNVTEQGVTAAPGSPHIIAYPSNVAVLPVK
jgi:hypothetical protein